MVEWNEKENHMVCKWFKETTHTNDPNDAKDSFSLYK